MYGTEPGYRLGYGLLRSPMQSGQYRGGGPAVPGPAVARTGRDRGPVPAHGSSMTFVDRWSPSLGCGRYRRSALIPVALHCQWQGRACGPRRRSGAALLAPTLRALTPSMIRPVRPEASLMPSAPGTASPSTARNTPWGLRGWRGPSDAGRRAGQPSLSRCRVASLRRRAAAQGGGAALPQWSPWRHCSAGTPLALICRGHRKIISGYRAASRYLVGYRSTSRCRLLAFGEVWYSSIVTRAAVWTFMPHTVRLLTVPEACVGIGLDTLQGGAECCQGVRVRAGKEAEVKYPDSGRLAGGSARESSTSPAPV